MRKPAAKVDRPSIERATDRAKQVIRFHVAQAFRMTEDKDREARLRMAECVVCHGGSRIGGSACTSAPCPLCGERINSGNTNIDVLCLVCALSNDLCKHCGADINLKNRRKPRAYESWPPPPYCINPECGQPVRGDYCCACGHRQSMPAGGPCSP